MKLTKFAVATALAMGAASPALADLMFPSLSYRTGPFAAGGIPFADGYADYFTLLNERDGGIGGLETRVVECETAYNTEKGVECYESLKGDGALVFQPLSTGITYQLIPKATEDQIPIHSMGYGRTSAADGSVFPWIFNYPGTYWDAASVIISHIQEVEGIFLEGQKIALVYHNSAFGKEPIRTLQELSNIHGFELLEIAVDSPGQEQRSQWLQIRREQPDYVIMWGWGIMNPTAIQEAANINFPMENFIGVWWSGSENDVLPVGEGAHGYKAVTFHGVGSDFPIFDDIHEFVVDRGLAAGAGDQVGTVLYNRGVYAAMLAAEAARTAQEIHGVADITGAMMRDGMEALTLDNDRLAELGLGGFGPEIAVSCENHGGPGLGAIAQWDAINARWIQISDFGPANRSVVDPLIEADAMAFAAESNITPRDCAAE